jgi:Arc/MetJ family transcription regulator
MLIIHDEALAEALRALAAREGRDVVAMLRTLVAEHTTAASASPDVDVDGQPGSWEWVGANLDSVTFATEHPLDPAQADEILNAEFADYLLKRMDDGATTNTD